MSTGITAPFFLQHFTDPTTNKPVSGGTVEYYVGGSTNIPKVVYADIALTNSLGNVLTLDAGGYAPQYYMLSGFYKIVLRRANGAIVYTRDYIEGGDGSATGDHKFAINNDDETAGGAGFFQDKVIDSEDIKWETVDAGAGILKTKAKLNSGLVLPVWTILKNTDPEAPNFGLAQIDLENIWTHHYGVAASLLQTTLPSSDCSIWYLEGGTYYGDATWVEKPFLDGQLILNSNKGTYDYLHVHPSDISIDDALSNYPAGLYSLTREGDNHFWMAELVNQYPDPAYVVSSFLKYDADTKTFVWLAADELTAKPVGPAGGDLFGTYPNPRVKELTGVPAMLTPSVADFNWKQSGSWASGAGIGFGYGYVNGVQTKVWMAISQLGELQVSYDEWKSEVYIPDGMPYRNSFVDYDGNTQLYNDVQSKFSGRYAAVTYLEIPGTGKFCWIFGAEGALFGLEAISSNFYANGSPKLENMFAWSYSGTDPNTINSNGTVMVFTGNSSTINYAEAADINWATKTITAHSASVTGTNASSRGVIGGNGCNGTSFMCVGRDSGIVMQSDDGKNWTVVDVLSSKFQDGTSMTKTSALEYTNALPMNTTVGNTPAWGTDGNAWGGMLYANDMWIVVNGKPAPSTINTAWSPFMFSYDKSNWNGYMPTADELAVNYSYSMYKIAYGHGKTFATNSDPFQDFKNQPAIYRLLMDEIPAHRKLVAEKGLDVIGTAALLDLPNAEALGTDEDGNIVAVPGTAASIGDAPKTDYAFSPFPWATRKWIPNDKSSGPVEALMGALVRDEVNHTITVPAYTVQLFDNNDFLGQPLRYNVAQTTFTLSTANVVQYVYARYISPGVAHTIITPFVEEINFSSSFPLFIVERINYTDGSSRIHQVGFDTLGEGLAQKTNKMMIETVPYRRTTAGGLMIGSSALQVTLTGAVVYAGVVPHTILAYNSNVDKLFHAYKVSGNWTYAVESAGTVNNSQYQNGNDLASLGTNKYKNVWIYRSIGDDKECFYVDSTAQYNTLTDALADSVPANLPDVINWHCMLVGRIAMQNGQTSGYTTQSAFINAFNIVSGSSGNFIRNQATDGTNDAPGNIFLDPAATINIRYEDTGTPANNVNWFSVSKDMLKLQGLDVNNPALIGYQAELTPSALALRGRPGTSYGIYNAAVIMSREQFNWVPNVNGAWYTFNHQDLGGGTAQAQGGYSFPRLRFRISDTDTVSAEMVHKIVDSNGNELTQVTNSTYGKALQIPTTIIAGTPNGQELFNYSAYELKTAIAQDGSGQGNNYGTRGFAFIALSSRLMTKGRMFVPQTGGSYMRFGIYDNQWKLIAKSARTAVFGGIIPFTLNIGYGGVAVAGAQLIGGERYYMAYWCDDTTSNLKFGCITGRNTDSDDPQPQIFLDNQEMPDTMGTSGYRTAFRPWMAVYEA